MQDWKDRMNETPLLMPGARINENRGKSHYAKLPGPGAIGTTQTTLPGKDGRRKSSGTQYWQGLGYVIMPRISPVEQRDTGQISFEEVQRRECQMPEIPSV